jgi:hypothetical protein
MTKTEHSTTPRGNWVRSAWVKYAAVALVAFGLGGAAGGGGGHTTPAPAATPRTVTVTKTRTVKLPPSSAARQKEHRRLLAERQKVATARKRLRSEQSAVATERSKLRRLTGQVSAARASSFRGTGTYLVGADVQPGTYRAAATPGCYWARLATLDTTDIIDNDNADGPVVVQLAASDKAFEVNGCGTFHRIGA